MKLKIQNKDDGVWFCFCGERGKEANLNMSEKIPEKGIIHSAFHEWFDKLWKEYDKSASEITFELMIVHASDCATNNEPALPNGECNCGAIKR